MQGIWQVDMSFWFIIGHVFLPHKWALYCLTSNNVIVRYTVVGNGKIERWKLYTMSVGVWVLGVWVSVEVRVRDCLKHMHLNCSVYLNCKLQQLTLQLCCVSIMQPKIILANWTMSSSEPEAKEIGSMCIWRIKSKTRGICWLTCSTLGTGAVLISELFERGCWSSSECNKSIMPLGGAIDIHISFVNISNARVYFHDKN